MLYRALLVLEIFVLVAISRVGGELYCPKMAQKRKNRQPLTEEELERLIMESYDELFDPSASYADEDDGWFPQSSDSDSDVSVEQDDEQNSPSTSTAAPMAAVTVLTSSKPNWTSASSVNPQGIQFSKTRRMLEAPTGARFACEFRIIFYVFFVSI